jgi:hypothetical protein
VATENLLDLLLRQFFPLVQFDGQQFDGVPMVLENFLGSRLQCAVNRKPVTPL